MPDPGTAGVVVYRRNGGIDAIDAYSRHVIVALGALGIDTRYFPDGLRPVLRDDAAPPWLLLQYQPFRYGRWGFAPRLLVELRRLRDCGVRVMVMVHEAWLDMTDFKTTVMGLWQRVQLRDIVRLADAVMTSTQALAQAIGAGAIHLPVGANIMPAPLSPAEARARLEVDGCLVVSLFGRSHPSRALGHAEAAISALVEERGADALIVLNLGADAPRVRVPAGVDVRHPGALGEDELSVHLRATDIMLLPFADGVSTRRSTLMAALAHGLPVLGLLGKNTDPVLSGATDALVLRPVGDIEAFASAAVELASDPALRAATGDAGRRLYERRFDWPLTAVHLAGLIDRL